jgi:HlyD family secretion protein
MTETNTKGTDPSKDSENQPSLIFRDEALAHFSTPSDMNKIFTLTRPHTWILLIIFGVLIWGAISWSVLGRIPITIQAQGILIPQEGIFDTVTAPEGVNIIQEMPLKVGDHVQKDQVIITLENPELAKNIADRKNYIEELKGKLESIKQEAVLSLQTKKENNQKQKEIIKRRLEVKDDHQKNLEDFLQKKQELLKKGYSNITDILGLENQINVLKEEELRAKEQMIQMDQDEISTKELWQQKEREIALKLADEERDFNNLKTRYESSKVIKSPIEGKVISIHRQIGDKVLVNEPIITISHGDEKTLEALMYINPLDGKEVKENMTVYMIPSYLEKEKSGYIVGKVSHISSYPETAKTLMATLQNEDLVKKFSESQPPLSARIKIETDPKNPGQILWTTGKHNEDTALSPGTWIYGRIVIKELSPLSIILPELKKFLGMDR